MNPGKKIAPKQEQDAGIITRILKESGLRIPVQTFGVKLPSAAQKKTIPLLRQRPQSNRSPFHYPAIPSIRPQFLFTPNTKQLELEDPYQRRNGVIRGRKLLVLFNLKRKI